jgi:ABC-type uncharacterized transport system substrate-binding protein
MKRWAMGAGLALAPLGAMAHPHVYIDTTVEVIFDEAGMAEGLRIGWTYDEFFSMLIIEDRALDPDYDAVLTAEAEAQLAGFDMQWDPGFPGDTYVELAGAAVALSRPQDFSASYDGGKITSVHVRRFAEPMAVAKVPLIVKVYDPGFYTAYAITGDVALNGRQDCVAEVFKPDPDAAGEALLAALAAMPPDADVEASYPEIGAVYAEEARITCANPS